MANDELQAIVRASQVFTPGAPVSSKALFSGRAEQLRRVIEAVPAPGRHPIIYGQRGVGKTSLANIIRDVVEDLLVVKISCDGSDTFISRSGIAFSKTRPSTLRLRRWVSRAM